MTADLTEPLLTCMCIVYSFRLCSTTLVMFALGMKNIPFGLYRMYTDVRQHCSPFLSSVTKITGNLLGWISNPRPLQF